MLTQTKRLKGIPWIGVVLVGAVALAELDAASAQEASAVTLQQLREELAERDALIIDLLNRVEALEAAGGTVGAGEPPGSSSGDPNTLRAGAVPEARRDGAELEVDALPAERALERGLVQEGARILSPGGIELVPEFALTHQTGMFPTSLMIGDDSVVGQIERKIDVLERNLALRIGLPFRSQLEIGLPHLRIDQQLETGIDGAVRTAVDRTGSGFGDATLGIARELVRGGAWRPNLIGRLVWLSGSGDERDGDVYLGGGNRGLAARMNAYWRRDPVVFLMSGGYTHYKHDSAIRPGDSYDFSLGLGLAISPETALILSLDQIYGNEFERDGVELPGTDRLSSSLGLSASTVLRRSLYLRVNAGVGLTEDAPDYRFGVALSSRFDVR